MDTTDRPALVLVHGAWHGAWCWEQLVVELEASEWKVSALDLPSRSGDPDAGLYADARAVREHLEGIDGPVTVLAHSYGGMPVTEVAAEVPGVTQLIYLAAHMLEEGESLVAPIGGPWFPPETTLLPPPDDPHFHLYGDLPAAEADAVAARLVPQSTRSILEELTRASWKTIPAAFIVCEQDKAFPKALAEKLPPKADLVRSLPASHSPFLSRPSELADMIDEITHALPRRSG